MFFVKWQNFYGSGLLIFALFQIFGPFCMTKADFFDLGTTPLSPSRHICSLLFFVELMVPIF